MPTLLRFLCLLPLLAATVLPAYAQGLRLDSLWGKFVGDVNAMTFTPDSKQLLVAGGDSWVRFFNAADGRLLDSIAPKYGCWHLQYSHDGSFLVAAGDKGLDVFDAQSLKSLYTLPLDFGEYSSLYNIDISPDDKAIAVKVIVPGVDLPQDTAYQRMLIFSYPELKLQWQEDVWLAWGGNSNVFFPKGKIAFSTDGNYLLGHKGYSLVRWNWKEASHQDEILLQGLPFQELIAYSPDRKYFVLKSNYIYSIPEKKLLNPDIEGLTRGSYSEYAAGTAFTTSSNTVVVTDEYYPHFVNLISRQVNFKHDRIAGLMAISEDSSYFGCRSAGGSISVYSINWKLTLVSDIVNNENPTLSTFPLPSKEQTEIIIYSPEFIHSVSLELTDLLGRSIKEVYKGLLNVGKTQLLLNNSALPSGQYFLRLQYRNRQVTLPFTITR